MNALSPVKRKTEAQGLMAITPCMQVILPRILGGLRFGACESHVCIWKCNVFLKTK